MSTSVIDFFRCPPRVFSRSEVLSRPSPAPASPGVYAWYFREVPPGVPTQRSVVVDGLTLLYIGIAPQPPAKSGKVSARTLRKRLCEHYSKNAYGSTLRRTLGCLLQERLGIELRRVGGERTTFGEGEQTLSGWMAENAFVGWVEHPSPWNIEDVLVQELRPPLNLKRNRAHPFYSELSAIREAAKARARALPIVTLARK
jgi:hypothetical protein